MSGSTLPSASPEFSTGETRSRRRPFLALLAVLFVVFWIGIVSAILIPVAQGRSVTWSTFESIWIGVFAAFLIIIGIVAALWVVRASYGGSANLRRRERRHRRRDYEGPPVPTDTAVELARQRYARGEISKVQLDEILRDLGKAA